MREFLVAALLAVFAVVPCLGQDFDVVKVPDTLFGSIRLYDSLWRKLSESLFQMV